MDVPEVEIKEFFKTGDLYVTDAVSGERRRFDQMGTGAQRAIQMALIRLEIGVLDNRARFFNIDMSWSAATPGPVRRSMRASSPSLAKRRGR